VIRNEKSEFLFAGVDTDLFILAWTTTPWTLPSNTALAVGADISYVKVKTFNPYTGSPIRVILAEDLVGAYFNMKDAELSMEDYKPGDKHIPFRILDGKYTGAQLEGVRYEQLMPWVKPEGDAFRVIVGDFVTTSDGTGIVHIAPTFGADDDRAARQAGVSPLLMIDKDGKRQPMVDRNGRFFRIEDLHPDFVAKSVNVEKYSEFAGRYVKNAYDERLTDEDATLDVDLSVMLKKEDRAFKVGKHIHSYPHCWRTDKPVLYYPLDSWFIRTTALRERMIELNNTINWKPASTGSGRFGKWLENLVDWNLSRSRYWGTPLPIWRTEDGSQELCIGSVEQLFSEIEKSVKAGLMKKNPFEGFIPGDYSKENYEKIDLHRPYVDEIILVSDEGKAMYREPDLIDVWFDSGAMPYAQMHYPFESKDNLPFPADFIAEGVDQTRGWFFTLHALATLLFDSVAFKNIISNGLVLDKNGNKMSKRLGNAVDPFAVIEQYGSDPLRWYMMTNSQPWDNLKFDISGVDEVKRKFFGTLYNTYSFFSLYANVDGFVPGAEEVPVAERPEIDRWIISVLNSLVKEVENAYSSYEPTRAGRALQDFVIENLSNWYVRLNRKRFWAGEYNKDKIAAYQTLYTCLKTVAVLSAPIAPFFMEKLYLDLTGENKSVHLAMMPECNEALIDLGLEERMSYAQQISSMVLALRRKVSIKVRQPLQKIMIPDMGVSFREQIDKIKDLVLSEVNVKELEYLADDSGVLVKKIKPNFKTLGPKHGKLMKGIAAVVNTLTPAEITHFEREGRFEVEVEGSKIELLAEDVEIISEDIPGWLVANEGKLTVALDITITEELRQEGLARELVNRIQNIRKDSGFEITDKIELYIRKHEAINNAVMNFTGYIGTQTLAPKISLVDECNDSAAIVVELDSDIETAILVKKISN
jgi:isoleucyl-tRNA synthetase